MQQKFSGQTNQGHCNYMEKLVGHPGTQVHCLLQDSFQIVISTILEHYASTVHVFKL